MAVLLNRDEAPELQAERFSSLSPITYALAVADRENVPYVVLQHGAKVRIYPSRVGVGVGRRGRTETYVECHAGLLRDVDAAYLWLLCSAEALAEGGSLDQLIEESGRFSGDLAERLRERIYESVIPRLAEGIVAARGLKKATAQDLADTYEMTMTVLFRLLFAAYAEDKDLLPYRWNGLYQRRSLKTKSLELLDLARAGAAFDEGDSLWDEVTRLFRAVDRGNREWGVPPYNGGLFSEDPEVSRVGALLAAITLPNTVVGPALRDLLLVESAEGLGPVDFRSLGVREFGTVYEGLLESELSIAEMDLSIDSTGVYRPTSKGEDPLVRKGQIYLHNASGARKASGSYFTKHFAVEHLLQYSLEPALRDHVNRLDALDEESASDSFFDLRVADIAMGSGHFLVSAVDHIERWLTEYLSRRKLPGVAHELAVLRAAALVAQGALAEQTEIEDTQLLRRLIARRCIYGVDRNPVAVQLARLAVWIHTFVPGLPLSFLDHNLVCGDSLVGIATVDHALRILDPDAEAERGRSYSIFRGQILAWIGEATGPLRRLAKIADASWKDIREAGRAHKEAHDSLAPLSQLLDLLLAIGMGQARPLSGVSTESLSRNPDLTSARDAARDLGALHLLTAFPEVFLRKRSGFDCIIGNPPWDKVMFEAQQFWVTRAPGLNAVPAARRPQEIDTLRSERPLDAVAEERERASRERFQHYVRAFFYYTGRGHYDFAKLFVERAVALLADDGHLGYVLPRNVLVLGGWTKLRPLLFRDRFSLVCQARNRSGWLFEDVHHSTMVVLLTRSPIGVDLERGVRVWPASASEEDIRRLDLSTAMSFTQEEIERLSEGYVIPWFEDPADLSVFKLLRDAPRLSSGGGWIRGRHDARWDFRSSGPHGRLATRSASSGAWRVLMTRHVGSFLIDRDSKYETFVAPRRLVPLDLGVALGKDGPELGPGHPLIVFRHPSRNDDTRTIIAAALAESGELHNKGYVHGIACSETASPRDQLALLGYLNTFLCDWWARRFVDRHVTSPIVNNLPLPAWTSDDRSRVAAAVSELLARRGTHELAGGVRVKRSAEFSASDDFELLAMIERIAADAYGLRQKHREAVLRDFSETACPPQLRKLIMMEP
ncbi:MAG: hypothetical protein IT386_18140 [Deltaproteobacteria bacterium]|nr:hypothetical protein [Deltaproteobacteria bacterium]